MHVCLPKYFFTRAVTSLAPLGLGLATPLSQTLYHVIYNQLKRSEDIGRSQGRIQVFSKGGDYYIIVVRAGEGGDPPPHTHPLYPPLETDQHSYCSKTLLCYMGT